MPPLYRMPIVYVVALVIAGGWAVWSRLGGGSTDRVVTVAEGGGETAGARPDPEAVEADPVGAFPTEKPVRAPAEPAAVAAAGDGILRNAEGLRRKVVVKALDARIYDRPMGGRVVAGPVDYFSFLYLYEPEPSRPGERWRVGPREGPATGWIGADGVLEWDSRLMARPGEGAGGELVYRDRECVVERLKGGGCGRHAGVGGCPIEAERPPDFGEGEKPVLGWPVLRYEAIADAGSAARGVCEVALLVRDTLPLPPPDQPPVEYRVPLRQVYLAFVVDTTSSMAGPIEAVKAFASELAASGAARFPGYRFHLGLVEYRDDDRRFEFIRRRVCDFAEPGVFRQAISDLEAARQGDGSTAEAVYEGLKLALEGRAGVAGEGLSWPTGQAAEAATKLIMVLGDAPDHAPGTAEAEALGARARAERITVAAIGLNPPPAQRTLSRLERERYRAQWQALAEGSFRPTDEAGQPLPALHLELSTESESATAESVRGELNEAVRWLLEARRRDALEVAARRQEEAEGRLQGYAFGDGRRLDEVAPVYLDTHRNEASPTARPDPRFGGRIAPSLRRGWVVADEGLRFQILIDRDELDWLINELSSLQQAVQGRARDVKDLMQIGTAVASGETSFLAEDRGELTFAEHIQRREGFPALGEGGLFARDQRSLLQVDDVTRAAYDEALSTALARLIGLRRSDPWSDPERSFQGLALMDYAWIDF